MNERIKELAVESGIVHPLLFSDDTAFPKLEKFAELIIKECIDLLNPEGDPYTSLREDYGRSLSMNMIKKHFGVEE